MKERQGKRIKSQVEVFLQDEGQEYAGTLVDVSRSGLSVRTRHVFPTFKEIGLRVRSKGSEFAFRGSVRWVHERPLKAEADFVEMGIAILSACPEFKDFIDRLAGDR